MKLSAPRAVGTSQAYHDAVPWSIDAGLLDIPLFRRVSLDDRQRVASASEIRTYRRGEPAFAEGDPSDFFFVVLQGRFKVFRIKPDGSELILDIFGRGGPLGAVAAYESRPYPAAAEALEDSVCLVIPRERFFKMLETYPSLVRGLLGSLSHRLVELTARLTELTGGRVEARFARLFLKLADQLGRPHPDGVLVPMSLGRRELADLACTTIETTIRIMSRWNKDNVLRTTKEGFVVVDRAALRSVAGE